MSLSATIPPGTVFRYRYPNAQRVMRPFRIVEQIGTSNRFVVEGLDGTRRREVSLAAILGHYEEAAS